MSKTSEKQNMSIISSDSSHGSYGLKDISPEVQTYIDIYLMSVGCNVIGSFGIIANIINFIILKRQGCKDCVSLCLLCLTFSDFFTGVFMVFYSSCYALSSNGVHYYLDPFSLMYVVSWIRGMFFDLSMLTTAFISVERCLSVLMPLMFKNLVTFKRAAIILVGIYMFTIGVYSVLYATHGLSKQWDKVTNSTRIKLWVSPHRAEIEFYVTTVFHMVNGTVCEIVVFFSTYGMIRGLRRSEKFRNNATAGLSRSANSASESTKDTKQSQRHDRIVRMISMLAVIFVFCNMVRLTVLYLRRMIPDIMFGKALNNTYNTLIGILFFFGTLNASVNIFIYYYYKPSFKAIFLSTFCHRGSKQSN